MNQKINNWSISSDNDLKNLAAQLNIQLDGIIDFRNLKSSLPSVGSFIMLLRDQPGVGHWVAIHDGYYFDSMGASPPTILNINKYSDKQYQGSYNEYCGIWCLLWLYSKQKNRSDLMQGFTDLDLDVDVYISQ